MLNKVICLFIKSVTQTLKCLIFLILFLGILGIEYTKNEGTIAIELIGIIFFCLVTVLMSAMNEKSIISKIKTFSCIGISYVISFLVIIDVKWQYNTFYILYLLGVMILAIIYYKDAKIDFGIFIRIQLLCNLHFISFVVALQAMEFTKVARSYLPIYLIMSLLYIVQVNLLRQYKDYSANLINEDRNILRVNLILITTISIIVIIFTTDFFQKIYDLANYILQQFIYILSIPMGAVMGKYANAISKYSWGGSPDSVLYKINNLPSGIKVILNIIIIIIFFNIIYWIYEVYYKAVKHKKIKKAYLNNLDFERKSFAFRNGNEKKIKNKIIKGNMKDLHVIRRIYIDVIKALNKKGIKYKNSYTPNEYNAFIESTEFKLKNIDQLTNLYNQLRYGNKIISKEDISTAYKIKKQV